MLEVWRGRLESVGGWHSSTSNRNLSAHNNKFLLCHRVAVQPQISWLSAMQLDRAPVHHQRKDSIDGYDRVGWRDMMTCPSSSCGIEPPSQQLIQSCGQVVIINAILVRCNGQPMARQSPCIGRAGCDEIGNLLVASAAAMDGKRGRPVPALAGASFLR